MEIRRQGECIVISDLDPFLAELLRQIPESTKADGVDAANERLFTAPAVDSEREICAEWKLYVELELRRLFESSTETIAGDLEQLMAGQSHSRTVHCGFRRVTRCMAECVESSATRHCLEGQFFGR